MSDGCIVSLLASATEIVAALGLTDRLIAISHECDYPARYLEPTGLHGAENRFERQLRRNRPACERSA